MLRTSVNNKIKVILLVRDRLLPNMIGFIR